MTCVRFRCTQLFAPGVLRGIFSITTVTLWLHSVDHLQRRIIPSVLGICERSTRTDPTCPVVLCV